MVTVYGEIGCDGRDLEHLEYDDDDDDDEWFRNPLGRFFDHVMLPVLLGTCTLILLFIGSASLLAILRVWHLIRAAMH